jgi:hypothetical protein
MLQLYYPGNAGDEDRDCIQYFCYTSILLRVACIVILTRFQSCPILGLGESRPVTLHAARHLNLIPYTIVTSLGR